MALIKKAFKTISITGANNLIKNNHFLNKTESCGYLDMYFEWKKREKKNGNLKDHGKLEIPAVIWKPAITKEFSEMGRTKCIDKVSY